MGKHKATLITASLLAAFHVLFVVIPTAFPSRSNECGAGQAIILVLLLDFPLVALTETLRHSHSVYYEALHNSMQFLWWGGTLMYAGVGTLIGWIIDIIRNRRPTISN